MNIFHLAGIACQPLSEFGSHFHINIPHDLRNVWLGHKNPSKRLEIEKTGLLCQTDWKGRLPEYTNELKRFDSAEIINQVVAVFKSKILLDYIFHDCYLLVKWENESFENVTINSDLNYTLLRLLNSVNRKRRASVESIVPPKKNCPSDPKLKNEKKTIRWPRRGRILNQKKPEQDNGLGMITLDNILYDCKHQRPILIPENLLSHILKRATNPRKFFHLNQLLNEFSERGKQFSGNNGFYRVFMKHIRYYSTDNVLRPVPKKDITSFMTDILGRLLPASFFGNSNRIRKRFYSVTAQLVNCDKHQVFSLEMFVECFRPSPMWMKEIEPSGLIKFMIYLATELIGNLLKNFFYITECGSSGYELFYYRKNDIESLVTKKINRLIETGALGRVSVSENLERKWLENRLISGIEISEEVNLMPETMQYQPAAAKVRFLPKSSECYDARMITIALKPPRFEQKWKLFQQRLLVRKDIMDVVRRWLDALILTVGTGIQPLYTSPQLKKAWDKIQEMKEQGKKLYFVKADIMDAFGSVNHARLFKMLERWCSKNNKGQEFLISEWIMRHGRLRKVSRCSFSRKVFPNRILHSIQTSQRPAISVDLLISVIKQIVGLQDLRIGRHLYRVQVGLCQGGVGGLSPRLCDLYYSGLDDGLRSMTSNDQSLLLRGIDDYLYVSVIKSQAKRFYDLVKKGVPLYNTRFNEAKLNTNLFEESNMFPYLGLLFDIDALTVEPNFSRYSHTNILHFIKLSYGKNDPRLHKDQFMVERCLNLNTLKIVPIIFKNKHNNEQFMKKVAISCCFLQVKRMLSLALYLKVSVDCLKYTFSKVSAKLSRTIHQAYPQISTPFVNYAFYQMVFSFFHKYDSKFGQITKIIQMKLIRLHEQNDLCHNETINFLKNVDVMCWKPWKKLI